MAQIVCIQFFQLAKRLLLDIIFERKNIQADQKRKDFVIAEISSKILSIIDKYDTGRVGGKLQIVYSVTKVKITCG